MTTGGTPRRTLLQRGLALLAGGVAVATGSRVIRAEGRIAPTPVGRTDPQPPGTTLLLYTRQRPIAPPPTPAPVQAGHARLLTSGDLLDAPDGRRIGAVYTNCFCPAAPFSAQKSGSDLEFQVMHLDDGTLFGMCGGTAERGARVRAIVGGTGRFAGARGVYLERPAAGERDVVEFVVTLAG
jgi:hypothetical protein